MLDGKEVYRTHVGGAQDLKDIDQKQDPAVDAINKRLKNIRFKATAGMHKVAVAFLERSFAESDARLFTIAPEGGQDKIKRIQSFEVRGPFDPTGVSLTREPREDLQQLLSEDGGGRAAVRGADRRDARHARVPRRSSKRPTRRCS